MINWQGTVIPGGPEGVIDNGLSRKNCTEDNTGSEGTPTTCASTCPRQVMMGSPMIQARRLPGVNVPFPDGNARHP